MVQKGFSVIIVGIILALALGVSGYFILNKHPKPPYLPPPESQQTSLDNYRDDIVGIKFKYSPLIWALDIKPPGLTALYSKEKTDGKNLELKGYLKNSKFELDWHYDARDVRDVLNCDGNYSRTLGGTYKKIATTTDIINGCQTYIPEDFNSTTKRGRLTVIFALTHSITKATIIFLGHTNSVSEDETNKIIGEYENILRSIAFYQPSREGLIRMKEIQKYGEPLKNKAAQETEEKISNLTKRDVYLKKLSAISNHQPLPEGARIVFESYDRAHFPTAFRGAVAMLTIIYENPNNAHEKYQVPLIFFDTPYSIPATTCDTSKPYYTNLKKIGDKLWSCNVLSAVGKSRHMYGFLDGESKIYAEIHVLDQPSEQYKDSPNSIGEAPLNQIPAFFSYYKK